MKVNDKAKLIMNDIIKLRQKSSAGCKTALEFVLLDIDMEDAIRDLSYELECIPEQIWVDTQGTVINLDKVSKDYLNAIRKTIVKTKAKFILKKLDGKTSQYTKRKLMKAEAQLAYVDKLIGG